jgi:hypothetical protein
MKKYLSKWRFEEGLSFSLPSLPPAFTRPTLDEKISEQVAI